jgi:hypothetical protein
MTLLNRLTALEQRTPASVNGVIAAQIAARLDEVATRRRAAGWAAGWAPDRDAVAAALDAEMNDAMERRRMIG